MAASPAPAAAPLASFVGLAALAVGMSLAGAAAAGDCFEAISPESAQKLFDALAHATPSDGCTLENVSTDRSQMTVLWIKGGRPQEAILVVPTSCVSGKRGRGKLSTLVSATMENACPAAVDATNALVEGPALGDPVPVTAGIPVPNLERRPAWRRSRIIALAAGGVAVAAGTGGGIFAFLRRKKKRALPAEPAAKPPEEPAP